MNQLSKHDVCGFHDFLPLEKEYGIRLFSNHKFHIQLTSDITTKRRVKDSDKYFYELQFPDNPYTYWANEIEFEELRKTVGSLLVKSNEKDIGSVVSENVVDIRLKKFKEFYFSLLEQLSRNRDSFMLETFPKSNVFKYAFENNYYCSIDSVKESTIECDCCIKWGNGMAVYALPPFFNCFKDCPNVKAKIECNMNHVKYSLCDNMLFKMNKCSRIYVFETNKNGFGVKSKSNIQSNTIITTYVGDVFNNFTIKNILINEEIKKTIGTYIQKLSDDNIICSYKNGNLSRFINHSCKPNARIERWISGSRYVLAIFANQTISKDEEITIDYGYSGDGEKCLCGTSSCRGKIGYFSGHNLQVFDKTYNVGSLNEITKDVVPKENDLLEVLYNGPSLLEVLKDILNK